MSLDATARRRWIGALLLVGAVAMVVAGQTVLKSRLQDVGFLVYWLICFLLTGLAIFVALIDARALRQRTRSEARNLLQSTLDEIATDARNKPTRKGDGG